MFLVPGFISNSYSNRNYYKFSFTERMKGIYLGYPSIHPLANDENLFWTSILQQAHDNMKNQGSRNIEKHVHLVMLSLANRDQLNFYLGFKYFWNKYHTYLQKDYQSNLIERIMVNPCSGVRFDWGSDLILPSSFMEIPSVLIPNLAYMIYNGISGVIPLIKSNISSNILMKFPYPSLRTLKESCLNVNYKSNIKKLFDEYILRKETEDKISSKTILEIINKLNKTQKTQVFKYLKSKRTI